MSFTPDRHLQILLTVAEKYEPDVAAVLEEYDRRYDEELDYQAIYESLEQLQRHGLLEKRPIDGRSNCYLLTIEGAEFLQSHREHVLTATEGVEQV